ncbi:MAG: class I SAM-dependent methyltransferase, partial [Acidimicrobiales bacterium]
DWAVWRGRANVALRCRDAVAINATRRQGAAHVGHKPTTLLDRFGALRGLLTISDEDYHAYMGSYGELFVGSPENPKSDYEAGVPPTGYVQGSSDELQALYKVIHLMCTLGSVEKMYMPPEIDPDKSVLQNQILFERIMAGDLQLEPGQRVLDLGCGCGAIAEHVADVTGAVPYGINLDKSQIDKAHKNPNLPAANFTVGDFNKPFQFGDATFDAVFAVQPMTYISDHAFTFSEVMRVLKPGGRFVINDVAALDAYDRDNEHHRTLIQQTRELTVFGGFWYYRYWEDAYRNAGFELVSSVGRSAVGMIKKEVARFNRYERIFRALAKVRVIPKKTDALLQRLNQNNASYIAAEEAELLSLNWHCVGQKPG